MAQKSSQKETRLTRSVTTLTPLTVKKKTLHTLMEKVTSGEKLVALTAYDYPSAYFLDACDIDILLVGDSLGNVVLGYENTLPVTMEEMLVRVKAVARGTRHAMIIADMPFLSYQLSEQKAVANAARFVKEAGAHGVKLEGAGYTNVIKQLVKMGIPVMGHLGLTPQSVHQLGGYRVQGKTARAAQRLLKDARALEKAGCFSIVLELMPPDLAKKITRSLSIPTIGIGAGPHVDGQILVTHDLIGFTPHKPPSFVRPYAHIGHAIQRAVRTFMHDIHLGHFPK